MVKLQYELRTLAVELILSDGAVEGIYLIPLNGQSVKLHQGGAIGVTARSSDYAGKVRHVRI